MRRTCESFLEVRDGYLPDAPLLGKLCDSQMKTFESASSRLLVTYVNNGEGGFTARYRTVCGGEITINDTTLYRLESPNYPLEYLPNKQCIWTISAPKGTHVGLRFDTFDLENHDTCVYDYVQVHDGGSGSSALIGKFCGAKVPADLV